MTLQNLMAIRRLQAYAADGAAVMKLLEAARRNLADARVPAIGNDNRFDAAYKCILQCATLGLWANGYRAATSQPGHHQTTLQCLPLTLGIDPDTVIVLDGLRKLRNLNDYVGDPVPDGALSDCIDAAEALIARTLAWLRGKRPDLLEPA